MGQRRADVSSSTGLVGKMLSWVAALRGIIGLFLFLYPRSSKYKLHQHPGKQNTTYGQVLLTGKCAKNRTLASSFGECSPGRRLNFRNAVLFHISYWLVWASQLLVYWQLSIPCSKLKLALQILLLDTDSEVEDVVCHSTWALSLEKDLNCTLLNSPFFPNSYTQSQEIGRKLISQSVFKGFFISWSPVLEKLEVC